MKELKSYQDEQYLRYLYNQERMLPSEIAAKFNVTPSLIYRYFRKFGIQYDKTIDAEKHRKYHCNYHYFDTIDSHEKAYWLGFITADGNIDNRKDRKDTHRLTIKLAAVDRSHLEKFNHALESNYPITPIKNCIQGKEYPGYQLRINSSILCNGLMKHGVLPSKSCKEIFLKDLIPKKYWVDFIRGEFDGDGCFSWWMNTPYIPECSISLCGSSQILNDMLEVLCKENDISMPTISPRTNNILFTTTIGGNWQVQRIMQWLYNGNTYLERKYLNYQKFVEEFNNPRYDEYKRKSNVYT